MLLLNSFFLFLHCPSASYQWYKLFSVFGEHGLFVLWTFKSSYVLISKDLLVAKMPKALGCSQDVVLWCVWLERNGRIFSWQSSIEFIWDRVVSFASLCCYAHDLFSCVFFSSWGFLIPFFYINKSLSHKKKGTW